jgi:hypothetical protein
MKEGKKETARIKDNETPCEFFFSLITKFLSLQLKDKFICLLSSIFIIFFCWFSEYFSF